jgi:tripartite-type tricarboxylate transporter receptor subunit TctC
MNSIPRDSISRDCAFAMLLMAMALPAGAQSYPSKPIRMVVPSGAGGNADILARITAEGLSKALGQPVLVDNQVGGRGLPGTSLVAKAVPDGHTVLMASTTHVVNASLMPRLPYDPIKDFAPVSMVCSTSLLLVAHPSVPANNMKELIALAKAKPGTLNYASAGLGSPANLGAELLNTMAGIKLVHVPYKITAQGNTDTIAGVVQLSFPGVTSLLPHVKAGKLKALGISSKKRSPLLPDVATVAETLPGYEATLWNGLVAPAATPRAVIAKLNTELVKSANSPEVKAKLNTAGQDVETSTPEEMGVYMEAEIKKWARVIKEAGIKVEDE